MKRLASIVLVLLAFRTPAFATSGQITDPAITDDGVTVSAQNLSLTLNDASCGGVLGPTRCGGLAGVLLDSASGCPEPVNGLPDGITTLWETDLASDHYSPWSPASGPVSVEVAPAQAYRICLYARYMTDQGQKYVSLQASAVVTSLVCEQALNTLDAAKAKLRRLRHRNAPPQKIKRATRKMNKAADAADAACP